MKEIASALVQAQQEMGNALKDSKNPFFKSKYADLNAVREACIPALNQCGIVVLQPIVQQEGESYVKTLLLHSSGETIEGMTKIVYAKQNDAQAQGSGITYARRYGLQSLVCIGAEDDDGNAASAANQNRAAKKPPAPKITPDQVKQLEEALEASGKDKIAFCQLAKINSLADLAASRFEGAIKAINKQENANS